MSQAAFGAREFDLTKDDFETLRRLVHSLTGIALADHKQDMLYNRLSRRLRYLGLRSFAQYLERLNGPEGDAEIGILINAITTNLTRFHREGHHFDHLQQVAVPDTLQRLRAGAQSRLRVWSAGCSSGEEAYGIAMSLLEAGVGRQNVDARVLATDLDTNMLATGVEGLYPAEKLDGLPPTLRERYVSDLESEAGPMGRMADRLRELIVFKKLNLMESWPMKGQFDAIFCRNVMIYFDHDTRRWLARRFVQQLRNGGWLYTGHAESMVITDHELVTEGRTIYRKVA
jgi:chemotaxis protein methyltransferase CheR